jgi:hypothetical protein
MPAGCARATTRHSARGRASGVLGIDRHGGARPRRVGDRAGPGASSGPPRPNAPRRPVRLEVERPRQRQTVARGDVREARPRVGALGVERTRDEREAQRGGRVGEHAAGGRRRVRVPTRREPVAPARQQVQVADHARHGGRRCVEQDAGLDDEHGAGGWGVEGRRFRGRARAVGQRGAACGRAGGAGRSARPRPTRGPRSGAATAGDDAATAGELGAPRSGPARPRPTRRPRRRGGQRDPGRGEGQVREGESHEPDLRHEIDNGIPTQARASAQPVARGSRPARGQRRAEQQRADREQPMPVSTMVLIGPDASRSCDACPCARSAAALGWWAASAGITAPSTMPCVPSRHHRPTK